jgi:hypothetical protein
VIQRAENHLTRNENNKHTKKKEMKNNLSFASILQPCSPAVEEVKLVKKNAIEGLHHHQPTEAKKHPSAIHFHLQKKALCFLALDQRAPHMSEGRPLSLSTYGQWKPTAREEKSKHSPCHAATHKHHRRSQHQPPHRTKLSGGDTKDATNHRRDPTISKVGARTLPPPKQKLWAFT